MGKSVDLRLSSDMYCGDPFEQVFVIFREKTMSLLAQDIQTVGR